MAVVFTSDTSHANGNNYIIADMEGNIRIDRLPKGRGPYHDPRAVT
jgi:hypothetical protein